MKYTTIEEVDNNCAVVILADTATDCPERMWTYNIVRKQDVKKISEHYIKSRYKPSTLPYYTKQTVIQCINDNLKRGHYVLRPKWPNEKHDELIIE